ncbi:MAG: sugar-binding protein, partial [Planctomycetota bacterium]|nr:sugar-binding protein [Planctomycetota bacterium]
MDSPRWYLPAGLFDGKAARPTIQHPGQNLIENELMNILSLVAFALPVQAEIVQFTERPFDRQLVCPGMSRPIVIDGKLDEWAGIPETEINLEIAKEVGRVDQKIDSDADCSARFRVAWDAGNFYFSANVTDDKAVAATAKTSKPWWCDSLQLYFRSTADGRDTGRFRDKATFKPLTYPFFGVSLTTKKTRNKFLPAGCKSIGLVTEDGWQVEAAIPWSVMGYDVRPGDAVRFAIVLVDNDPDPKSKWGQLIWMWNPHGSDDGRYWAKMRLGVKGSGIGAGFHLTAESAKGRGEVRTQVDAAKAAKLEKLHVADEAGDTVDEVPLGREVMAGTTTTVEASFRLPVDRQRKCRLVLSFEQDKKKYSIEKEFIPAELSARSPTKGSQAYLNRYVTIDEKRASRKTQTLPRYEKTTRDDYLEVVNLFFRKRSTPNLAWLKLPQPYPNLQANLHQARYFAFDFRVTRREESARHAVAFINQAHWLLENGDPEKERNVAPNYHSPNTINRIWSWLKGSKAFTDRTRAQLRDILLGCMPSFPERVEHGNFNRPFGMALRGQILLRYVPDAP